MAMILRLGEKYVTALHCLQETNFKYVDVQEWKKKVEKYITQIPNQENGIVIIILPGRELRTTSKID